MDDKVKYAVDNFIKNSKKTKDKISLIDDLITVLYEAKEVPCSYKSDELKAAGRRLAKYLNQKYTKAHCYNWWDFCEALGEKFETLKPSCLADELCINNDIDREEVDASKDVYWYSCFNRGTISEILSKYDYKTILKGLRYFNSDKTQSIDHILISVSHEIDKFDDNNTKEKLLGLAKNFSCLIKKGLHVDDSLYTELISIIDEKVVEFNEYIGTYFIGNLVGILLEEKKNIEDFSDNINSLIMTCKNFERKEVSIFERLLKKNQELAKDKEVDISALFPVE